MRTALIDSLKARNARVCVIGLGYVGLPLAGLAKERGYPVTGLDIEPKAVEGAKTRGLMATLDPAQALEGADCILICVPTPIDDDNEPDLSAVVAASASITPYLRNGTLVILESTVAPGTTREIVRPILEKSGLTAGQDFYLAHCPERVDPGNRTWRVENIPRVVGGIDGDSAAVARVFYEELLETTVVELSSAEAAEATKIVENAFRDINIAFVNELAKSFDKIGIDVTEVIRAAATKPFGFLPHYPGPGVGGHCIAIDPYYLIKRAGERGFEHRFLKLAREINDSMPEYAVQRAVHGLEEAGLRVQDTRVTVLGLAYKGGVDDTRESPALPIVNRLKELGAQVITFDPRLRDQSTADDLASALEGSDCVVLVTNHPEFGVISDQLLREKGVKVVVDARNMLDKGAIEAAGIIYKGIGR